MILRSLFSIYPYVFYSSIICNPSHYHPRLRNFVEPSDGHETPEHTAGRLSTSQSRGSCTAVSLAAMAGSVKVCAGGRQKARSFCLGDRRRRGCSTALGRGELSSVRRSLERGGRGGGELPQTASAGVALWDDGTPPRSVGRSARPQMDAAVAYADSARLPTEQLSRDE